MAKIRGDIIQKGSNHGSRQRFELAVVEVPKDATHANAPFVV
jgi:hypothetical protein